MALYAFDGTWNVRDRKHAIQSVQRPQYGPDAGFRRETTETNVHRFREFYGTDRCEYLQGVGTRFGILGRIFGGLFGLGGKWRIRKMYRSLCDRYHKGDQEIDIIGFSRGASLAVHFANVIATYGIRKPQGKKHWWFWYDKMFGMSFRMLKADSHTDVRTPPVRFLGLWDMVATFGPPIWPLRNRFTGTWVLAVIPMNVRHSFHAMALDEVRSTFELVRPQPKGDVDHHYEVWFRGVHSNVGGGYLDRGLSDIALTWMMEMYLFVLDRESLDGQKIEIPEGFQWALERLEPFKSGSETKEWKGTTLETLEPNPDGELGRPADIRRQGWRAIPEGALIHHSVYRRTRNLLLDHYSSNRRLLRQIPGDARPVFDPPFFYGCTPRQEAQNVAEEAFHYIPVRASEWLKVSGVCVVRGDDWLARGRQLKEMEHAKTKDTFVEVATEWLLSGGRPVTQLTLKASYKDYDGSEVPGSEAAAWIVEVLLVLKPFVPSLRSDRWSNPTRIEGDGAPVAATGQSPER